VTGDTAANASKASSSAALAAAQAAASSSVTSRPSSRATTSSMRGHSAVNARNASLWRLPHGEQLLMSRFETEVRAKEWIATHAAAWLKKYRGGRCV
jgi:hypothetical protein